MYYTITTLLVLIGAFIISALPLHLAVKAMGGKSTILRVIIVNFLASIVGFVIALLFTSWSWIITFILVLFLYKRWFKIGWIKSFIAWILQFVIIVVLLIMLGIIFGLALFL